MDSPKGALSANHHSWPQQVKAGALLGSVHIMAGGCLKERRDFIVTECCAFHKCCPFNLYSNQPILQIRNLGTER